MTFFVYQLINIIIITFMTGHCLMDEHFTLRTNFHYYNESDSFSTIISANLSFFS